jgi:quinol-cytochrome oxidoreductase complex cytochrome b subunit
VRFFGSLVCHLPVDDGDRLHGLRAVWGQMSFWGATVITNLFSVFPIVGETLVHLAVGRLCRR